MDIANLIQDYGYLAVALGSFLEGEAVLLAGSVAASYGHLELSIVLAVAAIASFFGDLPYFFAARRYGPAVLKRYPQLGNKMERVEQLLQRHHVLLVLVLRFLYGLRIAGLFALGASRISTARFLGLDFVGAAIWASAVCAAGYGAGRLLQRILASTDNAEQISVFAAILICSSFLVLLARRWRSSASRSRP